MQTFNKESAKKTLTYTWYLYPMVIAAVTFLWIFGYNAFHQPTNHERINLFIAAQVTNSKYEKDIKAKYEREKLREVNTNYISPNDGVNYNRKLLIYLSDSDVLILPKTTFEGFKNQYQNYFFPISDEMKQEYFSSNYEYYSGFEDGKTYGILFKDDNKTTWLNDYMTFTDDPYYLVLSSSSKNLGKFSSEDNAYYDNALTVVKYLMEGVQ